MVCDTSLIQQTTLKKPGSDVSTASRKKRSGNVFNYVKNQISKCLILKIIKGIFNFSSLPFSLINLFLLLSERTLYHSYLDEYCRIISLVNSNRKSILLLLLFNILQELEIYIDFSLCFYQVKFYRNKSCECDSRYLSPALLKLCQIFPLKQSRKRQLFSFIYASFPIIPPTIHPIIIIITLIFR